MGGTNAAANDLLPLGSCYLDRVDIDLQAQVSVLFPVVQDLRGEFCTDCLKLRFSRHVIAGDDVGVRLAHPK